MKIEFEQLTNELAVVATYPMQLTRIQGYFNGSTANRWLQLHDTKTRPANTAVPLRSWPLYMTAPFDWNFQNDPLTLANGCTLVVSTTQATYTDGSDTMDVYVNGSSEFDATGTSVVGDYTTAVQAQTVTASGTPKTLLRIEVTSLSDAGAALYLKAYAYEPDTAGQMMPLFEFELPRATNVDKWFNTSQVQFKSNVRYDGWYLIIDTAAGALVGDYVGTDCAVRTTIK